MGRPKPYPRRRWFPLLIAALIPTFDGLDLPRAMAANPGDAGADSAAPARPAGFDHEHARFARVLGQSVRSGRVNYAALKADRRELDAYIAELAAADAAALAAFSRTQALAYWLNAYNALVLRTVIDAYPISGRTVVGLAFPPGSIWQISGAFRAARHSAAGRRLSLDDIEHRIVRPQFADPRVHVALVCAAHSCPPLRGEPYRAAALSAQLDDQARRFLADRERGLSVQAGGRIEVSSIFKWFGEDFASLARGDQDRGIREFAARYVADPALAATLRAAEARHSYLDYDWRLNDWRSGDGGSGTDAR
jgi:hypothetical protein